MALSTQEIVNKLWNLCNVLRDDGITYNQYLNELTFILFLKMAEETDYNDRLPEGFRWENLKQKEGIELATFYRQLLLHLGTESTDKIQKIYNRIFQITGQNSKESYSWGGTFNTDSRKKTTSITMKLTYIVN